MEGFGVHTISYGRKEYEKQNHKRTLATIGQSGEGFRIGQYARRVALHHESRVSLEKNASMDVEERNYVPTVLFTPHWAGV